MVQSDESMPFLVSMNVSYILNPFNCLVCTFFQG
jgi:hypothetical protein